MSAAVMRWAVSALICAAAVAAGGCDSISDDAQRTSLAALRTKAPPPRSSDKLEAQPGCKDGDFASPAMRALPPPGQMRRGTFMRKIQDSGKLVAGVDQNTLGLGYYDAQTKTMTGLDIELVRAVAKAIFGDIDDRITYKAISTQQRESAIIYEDVDIVASAFTITCKRRSSMLFSSVYHVAQQRLLVPESSTVRRLSDLRGKRVCATRKSTSIANLEGTGAIPYPVALRPDCLVKLQEGLVDAITSDDAILLGFKQQDPRTKIVGPSLSCEHYGLAINEQHPEFVRFVNAVLERLGSRGLKRLREQYLRDLKPAPGPPAC